MLKKIYLENENAQLRVELAKQNVEIERLKAETEKMRQQVQKEAQLRYEAEENLHLVEIQLRKEQETVQLLRKMVIGLETKLSGSAENQKLPEFET